MSSNLREKQKEVLGLRALPPPSSFLPPPPSSLFPPFTSLLLHPSSLLPPPIIPWSKSKKSGWVNLWKCEENGFYRILHPDLIPIHISYILHVNPSRSIYLSICKNLLHRLQCPRSCAFKAQAMFISLNCLSKKNLTFMSKS